MWRHCRFGCSVASAAADWRSGRGPGARLRFGAGRLFTARLNRRRTRVVRVDPVNVRRR